MTEKLKEYENKIKSEYNINANETTNNLSSKGFLQENIKEETNKENEEENIKEAESKD